MVQGEFEVSEDPNVVMSTLLGSCVSTCLFDQAGRIGGMNHFLLASSAHRDTASERYGLYAMEVLVNGLLKLGANKSRLEAKVFGGATMSDKMGHIGEQNSRFALDFLEREGIPVRAKCLGGTRARRLKFSPSTGQVRQRIVHDIDDPDRFPTTRRQHDDIQFFED